jgi:glycerol uptake facilitator-like aquaporin
MAAFWMELVLTAGLVSVILGTASGAQNVGIIGAFGVGGYIALADLWGSPISGASMNPARTFGPDLVATTFTSYWGLHRGTDRRRRARRGHRLHPARPRRRQTRGPGRPG